MDRWSASPSVLFRLSRNPGALPEVASTSILGLVDVTPGTATYGNASPVVFGFDERRNQYACARRLWLRPENRCHFSPVIRTLPMSPTGLKTKTAPRSRQTRTFCV